MKKTTLILWLAICLTQITFAQQKAKITNSFLLAMQGDWKGKLTYTDYQDDKSQTTMDVWQKSDLINNKLVKQFFYKEPDGNTKQKSATQDTTYIIENGKKVVESGYKLPFTIKKFTTKANVEKTVVMETLDEDNNKKSTIRITITLLGNSMTIKKEVKYEGTKNFFVRHTFYYSK